VRHCQRQHFTFQIPPVSTKRILTISDIAKGLGITSRRLRQLLAEGWKIPAKQKHLGGRPSGKYQRIGWYDSAELRLWIERMKGILENRYRTTPKSRTARNKQRCRESIAVLMQILDNREPVRDWEKSAALYFFESLIILRQIRYGRLPIPSYPLLEGIEAIYRLGWTAEAVDYFMYGDRYLEKIEQLPTLPETKPQTEQSSLNA